MEEVTASWRPQANLAVGGNQPKPVAEKVEVKQPTSEEGLFGVPTSMYWVITDMIVKASRDPLWWFEDGPPAAVPSCGFDNSLCATDNTTIYILLAVVCCVALCAAGYLARGRCGDGISSNTNWKLDAEKIQEMNTNVNRSKGSVISITEDHASRPASGSSSFQSRTGIGSNTIGQYTTMKYDSSFVYVSKLDKLKDVQFHADQIRTLNKMKNLTHDNVAAFLGIANSIKLPIYIVWGSSAKRTLRDTMHNNDLHLDDDFIASFLRDVTNGLKYIHHSPLGVHGSLTSDTCTVDSRLVVRLTDYGTGAVLAPLVVSGAINVNKLDYELLHLAPEALKELRSVGISTGSKEADMYSIGMVFYEIVTKQELYFEYDFDSKVLLDKIHQGGAKKVRPTFPEEMHAAWKSLRKLIEMCWDANASTRPSIDEVHTAVTQATKGFSGNIIEKMIRRMEIYTNDLEKVVAERTLEVQESQERAEKLLHQLLPKSVADRLQAGLGVEPEWYDSATILFTDIVGFTTMAGRHTAIEIVTLLNLLYSAFDDVIDKHDAYKVETIGDAYMVVSGIPNRIDDHAHQIASLAIGMRDCIAVFKPPFGDDDQDNHMRIRLGCATGSVATGVIGVKMPKFCLFGDTVNFASRMESHGVPMKIQINARTAQDLELDPMFEIVLRGEIEVKGKGLQKTYFVDKKTSGTIEESS